MKTYTLFILLLGFLHFNCNGTEITNKIYIDNGIMGYAYAPKEADAAVELYLKKLSSNKTRKHYLPGSVCYLNSNIENKAKNKVIFPLAWAINNNKLLTIFPRMWADSIGRIVFDFWTAENPSELEYSNDKGFLLEDQIMRYRGFLCEDILYFMSSVPFSKSIINNNSTKIWYDLNSENILVRLPITDKNQKEWNAISSPDFFRWIDYSIFEKETIFVDISDNLGYNPITSISLKETKVLSDKNISFPPDSKWAVWMADDKNNLKIFYFKEKDKKLLVTEQNISQYPKTIIFNNDLKYIFLLYDYSFDSQKPLEALDELTKHLENKNLLQKPFIIENNDNNLILVDPG